MSRCLLLLCAALPLLGCLEDRSETVLGKDGRGTFVQRTVVHMEKAAEYVKQLRAEARSLGEGGDEGDLDPFEAIDALKREKALRGRAGIRVVSRDQATDEQAHTRTYELKVAFDSLKAFYLAGVIEDVSVKLEPAHEGKAWKLTVRHVFEGSERDPLDGPAAERLRKLRESMLARYEAMWGSMSVESTMTLPTKVLETNGTRGAEGRTASWRIGFADLADPKKLVQEVIFEAAEDLKLEAFELSAADIANALEEAELAAEEARDAGQGDAPKGDGEKGKDGKGEAPPK